MKYNRSIKGLQRKPFPFYKYIHKSKDWRLKHWYPSFENLDDLSLEEILIYRAKKEIDCFPLTCLDLFFYSYFKESYIIAHLTTHIYNYYEFQDEIRGLYNYIYYIIYDDMENYIKTNIKKYFKYIDKVLDSSTDNESLYSNYNILSSDLLKMCLLGNQYIDKKYIRDWRKYSVLHRRNFYTEEYKKYDPVLIEWALLESYHQFLFVDFVMENYKEAKSILDKYVQLKSEIEKKKLKIPYLLHTVNIYDTMYEPFLYWFKAKKEDNIEARKNFATRAMKASDKLVKYYNRYIMYFEAFISRLIGMWIRLEFDLERELVIDFLKYTGNFAKLYTPANKKAAQLNVSPATSPLDEERLNSLLKNIDKSEFKFPQVFLK